MTCTDLLSWNIQQKPARISQFTQAVDLKRYANLPLHRRNLILGWFNRAWEMRDCNDDDSFQAFNFLWMAFNGWASCVAQTDRDREWKDSLILNQSLCADFDKLVADENLPLASPAYGFLQLWPIFKSEEIHRRGIPWPNGNRQQVVKYYLANGIAIFEPQCWTRHQAQGNVVPLDWPHTLSALSRVRNNLIHGGKAGDSEMNRAIVASAFRVLLYFIDCGRYLHTD